MNDTNKLSETLHFLLEWVGRDSLKQLGFEPVTSKKLDWHLTRLGHLVASSYLPFATDDRGLVVVHLWPGRPLEASPILYISDDEHQVRFMCDQLATLPTALLLGVGQYYKEKLAIFRQALNNIALRVPDAQRIPDEIWSLLENSPEFTPTWWSPDCDDLYSSYVASCQCRTSLCGSTEAGQTYDTGRCVSTT